MEARCGCGGVVLAIETAPKSRMFCHCTVCQRANGGPFGDITILRPQSVKVRGDVRYRRMKLFPISVRRGFCAKCNDLIVEHLWPSAVGITIVPSPRYADDAVLPQARGHVFYETRVADIEDGLPKYEGFVRSQLAATRWMLPAYLS